MFFITGNRSFIEIVVSILVGWINTRMTNMCLLVTTKTDTRDSCAPIVTYLVIHHHENSRSDRQRTKTSLLHYNIGIFQCRKDHRHLSNHRNSRDFKLQNKVPIKSQKYLPMGRLKKSFGRRYIGNVRDWSSWSEIFLNKSN